MINNSTIVVDNFHYLMKYSLCLCIVMYSVIPKDEISATEHENRFQLNTMRE